MASRASRGKPESKGRSRRSSRDEEPAESSARGRRRGKDSEKSSRGSKRTKSRRDDKAAEEAPRSRRKSRRGKEEEEKPIRGSKRTSRREKKEDKKPSETGRRSSRRGAEPKEEKSGRSRRSKRKSGGGESERTNNSGSWNRRGRGEKKSKKWTIIGGIAAGVVLIVGLVAYTPLMISSLMGDLRSKYNETRAEAVRELIKYGPRVEGGLLKAAENSGAEPWPDYGRESAVLALALLDHPNADGKLTSLGTRGEANPSDDDIKIRRWVMKAIGAKGITRVNERFKAEMFLANVGGTDHPGRIAAINCLKHFRNQQVVDQLIKLLNDEQKPVGVAAEASLREIIRPEDALLFAKLLDHEKEPVQTAAKTLLVLLEDKKAIEALGKAMEKANDKVTIGILDVFSKYSSKSVTPFIAAAMKRSSVAVQCRAMEVAGKKKLVDAYDAIVEASKGDVPEVKVSAAKAIEGIGSPVHAAKIHHLLTDKDESVRLAGIMACRKCADRSCTGILVEKLLDMKEAKKTFVGTIQALTELYPIRGENIGRSTKKWKTWWRVFGIQLAFLEELEAKAKQNKEDLVNGKNEDKKRIQAELRDKLVPEMNQFEKGVFTRGTDKSTKAVIDEFKQERFGYINRFKKAKQKLEAQLHQAMKAQTL